MIKQFSILLTLSAAAICAYAQSEIPTDVEIKLDEQAQKLFPEDARAQQRWLNTQKDSYLTLPYIVAADKEDETLFKSAAQTAEKLFPLDYEKRMKFLNDAAAALANITSYKSYFPAEAQKTYEKIKADCLSQNPEDYRKAAKDFEAKIQAVIELDAIPFPEMVDDALKSALKGAAARKFPNDYAKQKEYLSAWSDRFVNFSIYESERQAQEKQNAKGGGNISAKINDAFAKLKNQILKVKSESETLGYCIAIQNKPFVIFPS
ncbi:MAG: hypothetical protein J6P03_06940, partial [Opitutales bacterium]|nr:hypothetical protein [Opitutales bacterium]